MPTDSGRQGLPSPQKRHGSGSEEAPGWQKKGGSRGGGKGGEVLSKGMGDSGWSLSGGQQILDQIELQVMIQEEEEDDDDDNEEDGDAR